MDRDEGSTNTSICPKGWTLPTDNNFSELFGTYNENYDTAISAPLYFVTGGYMNYDNSNLLGLAGLNAYYWSNSLGHTLLFHELKLTPVSGLSIRNGASVRCVAR